MLFEGNREIDKQKIDSEEENLFFPQKQRGELDEAHKSSTLTKKETCVNGLENDFPTEMTIFESRKS